MDKDNAVGNATNKVEIEIPYDDNEIFKSKHKDVYDGFLMTTGNNFEGYSIQEYCGIVHSECAVGTGFLSEISLAVNDFLGTNSELFEEKINKAKEWVEEKIKRKAILNGGNAVICVDYEITTLVNNMVVISADATAVKIQKTN